MYAARLLPFAFLCLALNSLTHPATAQPTPTCPSIEEAHKYFSLYNEDFKQSNYKDALPPLRWLLAHCPTQPSNTDRNFERAVIIYESLAEDANSPADQRAYLDSALVMFDRAVPVLQEVGAEVDPFIWARNKGRFIQEHLDVLDDLKGEAIEAYRKAYELDPNRIDPYYLRVILADDLERQEFEQMLDFINELETTRGDEEAVRTVIDTYLSAVPPYQRLTVLKRRLEATPDDTDILQQIVGIILEHSDDEEVATEREALLNDYGPRLLNNNPSAGLLRVFCKLYLDDGDYEQAATLCEQIRTILGVELLAEDLINMGIAQEGLGHFGEALSRYQQAKRLDTTSNRAALAIANLYATAVATCPPTNRRERAVYWLVADAYQQAGEATRAASYRTYFPDMEAIHFESEWTEGESTSVEYTCQGLTISGSTVVRPGT